jgi:hypothetical protein
VPGQHQDGDDQHAGIEQFLPGSLEQVGDEAGRGRHEPGADKAGHKADDDPQGPSRHAARCGEHDPDDQPGLDDLAEDDDERADHDKLCWSCPARDPLAGRQSD